MTGRALAVVSDLGADLQPAGWRLTDAPGIDHRRARSLLAQDLDALEEQAQGYAGTFKVQVAGPWTLAATVEKPRGDKVLADHGARRDLAQALAEGVRDHVRRPAPPAARASTALVSRSTSRRWRPCWPGRCRPRPASAGTGPSHPPEASEALGVGARRDRRGGRRAVGALLRGRYAAGPAARRRRAAGSPSTSRSSRPPTTTRSREALEAGETVALGVVPVRGPGDAPEPTPGHRAGAALAGHARPRPGGSATGWWSPRPAGSPVPRRTGRGRRCDARRRRAAGDRRTARPRPELRAGRRDGSWCQPTWTGTSGPSVASSACLTLRKIQTTSEAPSIRAAPTRNALVAPSVKILVPGDLLQASRPARGRLGRPAAAGLCRSGPSSSPRSVTIVQSRPCPASPGRARRRPAASC